MASLSRASILNLLQEARAGDRDALGQLFEVYRGYIMLLARLQIDQRIKAKVSASDLAQETFLHAHRGFASFRGSSEAELIHWLRRILANCLVSLVKRYSASKRDVRLEVQIEDDLNYSSQNLGRHSLADRRGTAGGMAGHEQAILLADALTRLNCPQREVIVLRHFYGLPFGEVASRMNRTLDSVKGLWVRGMIKLRENLEDCT